MLSFDFRFGCEIFSVFSGLSESPLQRGIRLVVLGY